MKKVLILLCMSAFCLLSCNHVPSNPQKGAERFCKEMSRYAKSNNCGEAYDRLSQYQIAYDSDQYNQFCWALRDKLKSSEYNHVSAS